MSEPREAMVEKLRQVAAATLHVPVERIGPQTRFDADLGADPMTLVLVVMAFEEAYGIEVPDDVAHSLRTVTDAAAFFVDRLD